jgi:hypothetical protein
VREFPHVISNIRFPTPHKNPKFDIEKMMAIVPADIDLFGSILPPKLQSKK